MKRLINQTSRFFYNRSLGLLLIRIAIGLIFLTHGYSKVVGISRTIEMFAHMGFPVFIAYFIAWLEVLGGLALILGVATRFFGVVFGIEMLVATFLGGFARGLGMEFVLVLISFALALTGSGRYSIYKMECDKCGGMLCSGDGSVCVVTS